MKNQPEIIRAYRKGAVSPRPLSIWLLLILSFLLGATFAPCQTLVITNRNSTPETIILYVSRHELPDTQLHLAIQANSTIEVPFPSDAVALGVDKEGDSWGFSGGIPFPGVGQTQYLYINGTATYPFDFNDLPSPGVWDVIVLVFWAFCTYYAAKLLLRGFQVIWSMPREQ